MNLAECALVGVLQEQHRTKLFDKLRAVSYEEVPIKLTEHVYKATTTTTQELRVTCEVTESPPKWSLLSVTPISARPNIPAIVRGVIKVSVSDNVRAFVEQMGFSQEFELLRDGWMWRSIVNDRRYTVTVCHINKVTGDEISAGFSNWYFVELLTYASDEELTKATEELANFAEHLAPTVDLQKIDYRHVLELQRKNQQQLKTG